MSTVRVSIIIPVYNAQTFIARSLASVCEQTLSEIEIIVVDDASTDGSARLVTEAAKTDSRIAYHRLSENVGPAAARNKGLQMAHGDYVFFLDADDTMDRETLEMLISVADSTSCDLVVCDSSRIINQKNAHEGIYLYPEDRSFDGDDILNLLVNQLLYHKSVGTFFGPVWGKLFKRQLIARHGILFPESLRTFEDLAFCFDYVAHANNIRYIRRQLYNYHIHENMVTTLSRNPSPLDAKQAVLKAFRALLSLGCPEATAQGLAQHGMVNLAVKVATVFHIHRFRGKLHGSIGKKEICGYVRTIAEDEFVHGSLRSYHPKQGESRWIPFFMKWGCFRIASSLCARRASKIIGRGK